MATTADTRIDQGRWLRLPGPTVLHPRVVEALQGEMIQHRGPQMKEIVKRTLANAKTAHMTDAHVAVWPGSGSAGWEAAIVNLFSPGDQVVVTVCGDFGQRFADLGELFGLRVKRIDVPWGAGVTPEMLETAIGEVDDVKGVFITHNETSTGVTNPLPELAKVARRAGALVVVDAVSSVGAIELRMDDWDLDWVLSGSQKAWMCPPGLMISAVSERGLAAAQDSGYHRYFWDIRPMLDAAKDGLTTTTAPVSLFYAFDVALQAFLEEGLEAAWARHAQLAAYVRDGATSLGYELLADPAYASDSITAIKLPDGVTSGPFIAEMKRRSGIELAPGQGPYKDSLVRVGHMGWVHKPELEATLEALGTMRHV